MVARIFLLVCFAIGIVERVQAQSNNCQFTTPFFHMHFGKGNVQDVNTRSLSLYDRVSSPCPNDGQYSIVSSTADCFSGDWHTLSEDHTPGEAAREKALPGRRTVPNHAFVMADR